MVLRSESSTKDSPIQINSQANKFKYISAPYIKSTSERVNRILNKIDMRLEHKLTNTLRNKLCKLKDERKSQVAYDAQNKLREIFLALIKCFLNLKL